MTTIALCSGSERPCSIADVMRTRLGDVDWAGRYEIAIPIRRGGIAVWLVLVSGLNVRAVRVNPVMVVKEGSMAPINIRKKSKPKFIM